MPHNVEIKVFFSAAIPRHYAPERGDWGVNCFIYSYYSQSCPRTWRLVCCLFPQLLVLRSHPSAIVPQDVEIKVLFDFSADMPTPSLNQNVEICVIFFLSRYPSSIIYQEGGDPGVPVGMPLWHIPNNATLRIEMQWLMQNIYID